MDLCKYQAGIVGGIPGLRERNSPGNCVPDQKAAQVLLTGAEHRQLLHVALGNRSLTRAVLEWEKKVCLPGECLLSPTLLPLLRIT